MRGGGREEKLSRPSINLQCVLEGTGLGLLPSSFQCLDSTWPAEGLCWVFIKSSRALSHSLSRWRQAHLLPHTLPTGYLKMLSFLILLLWAGFKPSLFFDSSSPDVIFLSHPAQRLSWFAPYKWSGAKITASEGDLDSRRNTVGPHFCRQC